MANYVENLTEKKLYMYYSNENVELIAFLGERYITHIKVLAHYINEVQQELVKDEFYSFNDMCKYYNISNDTNKYWKGNRTIDCSEEDVKFDVTSVDWVDTFYIISNSTDGRITKLKENTEDCKENTIKVITSHVDKDTY